MLPKNLGENQHRQVEAYQVPGKLIKWDEAILPKPKGTNTTVGILMKAPSWLPDYSVDSVHSKTFDAIFGHNRTVGFYTNIFREHNPESNLNYIDAKGTSNWLNREITRGQPRATRLPMKSRDGMWGLMNKSEAEHDHKIQKIFKKIGIRTHESIGYYELKYIYLGSEKVEVSKYFELPKDFVPVQQIRGFATPYRIDDITSDQSGYNKVDQEKSSKDKILEAMLLASNETGLDMLDPESYLLWFVQTMAKNIGLMHKNKFVHKYLHSGNITLDARIVDFDSVSTFAEELTQIDDSGYPTYIEDTVDRDKEMFKTALHHLIRSISIDIEQIDNIERLEKNLYQEFEDVYSVVRNS